MKLCKIVISLLLVFCTIAAPLTLAVEPGGMIMTVYADTQKVTITGDNVNVRSGAGTSYSKVTTAKKGATYNVLGTSKDSSGKKWYKISVSGKTGYVIETYVKVSTVTTTTSQQRLTVTANKVNVRSGAGSSYSKVTSVDKGAVFTVLGSAKDSSGKTWYKISVSGKTGYIISDYASVSAAPTTTTTTAAQQKLTVTGDKVNVRSGAGSSYSKVTTVNSGATYTVLGSAKDSSGKVWYKISVGGKTGYIISTYVKLSTASTTTTTKKTTTTTAASGDTLTAKSAAGVYASPTKSAAKSATMKAGTVYKYTSVYTGGDKVKWYLVTVGTARGWVCSSDVTLGGTTTTTKKPTTTTAASGGTLTAKSAAGAYASPTKSAAKSATMKAGTVYKYTSVYTGGDKVKWYLVTVGTARGWVCSSDVTLGGTTTTTKKPTTTTAASGGTLTAKSAAGAYASPTKSAAKSATMKAGTVYKYTSVYVGGDKVKWYLVTVGTARGWVCSSDVTLGGTTTTTKKPTTTTTASGGTLTAKSAAGAYASPTKSAAKSATMKKGEVYKYTSVYVGGDKVKWYLVKVGTSTGWVCSSDVTLGGTLTSATTSTSKTTSKTTTTSKTASSDTSKTTSSATKTTSSSTTKTTTSKTTTTTKKPSDKILTAKSAAGVYKSPTTSSEKIAAMKAGTEYTYTSVYTGGDGIKWYLITIGNESGWTCGSWITVGTTTTKATTTTTTITGDQLLKANVAAKVYKEPDSSSTKVATLNAGQSYEYTSTYVGGDKVMWYLVKVGSKTGWVSSKDVTCSATPTTTTKAPTGDADTRTIKTGKISTETGGTLRVRASASTSANVLGQIADGTKITIVGEASGTEVSGKKLWYKIEYGNSYGYVNSYYVSDVKTETQNISISFGTDYYYVNVGSKVTVKINGASGISYKSSNSTNAPITSDGVVTGKKAGVYRITATLGSLSTTADVVVLAPANTNVAAMTISEEGTAFIAGWEGGGTYVSGLGTVFYPYKDVSGYWTVGYGHAKTTTASKAWDEAKAIEQFNIDITNLIGAEHILTDQKPYLTQEEATNLLHADLNKGPYVTAVSDWAIRNGVKLNQQQFDSLVSFCYNLGPAYWTSDSTKFYLKSAIISHRDGSKANSNQIIEGFTRYIKSGGLNYKGLWWRRRNEAEMFIKGDYAIDRGEKFPLPTNITWA